MFLVRRFVLVVLLTAIIVVALIPGVPCFLKFFVAPSFVYFLDTSGLLATVLGAGNA